MKIFNRIIYFTFLLLLMPLSSVSAHPHSFITLQTHFVTEDNKMTAIKFKWTMDEMTSLYLKYEARNDPKGVADELLINIFENHFFSEFWLKAEPQNSAIRLLPQKEGANLNLDSPKAEVTFIGKLKDPIELSGNQFELITYEKTFYVDMYYENEKDIAINTGIENNNKMSCKKILTKPTPDDSLIDYASSLDQNENPIESDDFILGKLFAQKVVIQCQ